LLSSSSNKSAGLKVSIVTISFNQAEFLERALHSVSNQDYPNLEYIVVDPGSTDGSLLILNQYRGAIDRLIIEPDAGPADGLNKGFSLATGDIFGFLNSDDILLPGAIAKVVHFFEKNRKIDVVSADAILIDANDTPIRKLYSDRFSLIRYAYGANFIAQQSTFFKSSIFKQSGGFNNRNHIAWDGELFVDIAMAGGRFALIRDFWSGFRSHPGSISASGRADRTFSRYRIRIFRKILGRDMCSADYFLKIYYRMLKHFLNPLGVVEHLRHGSVYGRLRHRKS
jgi:glycosyltransferase involved in cell wall biosynthesis